MEPGEDVMAEDRPAAEEGLPEFITAPPRKAGDRPKGKAKKGGRKAKAGPPSDETGLVEALLAAARAHRNRSAVLLAREGLHPGQDALLLALAGSPAPIGTLAARLGVQAPTISKAISRLGEHGLVERAAVDGDRRLVSVRLTEAGEAKLGALRGLRDGLEREVRAGLDDKERRRLRKLLRRITRTLDARGAKLPPEEDEGNGE